MEKSNEAKEKLSAYFSNYYQRLKDLAKEENIKKFKDKLKERMKRLKEGKKTGTELLLQIFIAIIIPVTLFFPQELQTYSILIIILLIVLIALFFLLSFYTGIITLNLFFIFRLILILIIVIFIYFLPTFINCGKHNCFEAISTRVSRSFAYIVFFLILAYFLILAFSTDIIKFSIITLISTFIIMFAISFLASANWYSTCKKIPFLSTSSFCNPVEKRIDEAKVERIPTRGGIETKINVPETLYAGENYQYSFYIYNDYEEPISIKLKPTLIIKDYGLELYSPFNQKTEIIKNKKAYQDLIIFDSQLATPTNPNTCPWLAELIAKNKGFYSRDENNKLVVDVSKVECAMDKPCESENEACVKTAIYECKCVDWVEATCKRNEVKAKLFVSHTGFIIGNISLYYSEIITKPRPAIEFRQGPVSLKLELLPNPYVPSVHKYVENVLLFVTIKSNSGNISVSKISVYAANTNITTVDREKEIEVLEEIGTEIIECKDASEAFPFVIPSGKEVGGVVCKLKPPHVRVEVRDLKNNTVTEITNVTIPFIKKYCEKKDAETEIEGWASSWDQVYSLVDKTGLCEYLKTQSREKKVIESALSYTTIFVRVDYLREDVYYSKSIQPYTRTQKCIELFGEK